MLRAVLYERYFRGDEDQRITKCAEQRGARVQRSRHALLTVTWFPLRWSQMETTHSSTARDVALDSSECSIELFLGDLQERHWRLVTICQVCTKWMLAKCDRRKMSVRVAAEAPTLCSSKQRTFCALSRTLTWGFVNSWAETQCWFSCVQAKPRVVLKRWSRVSQTGLTAQFAADTKYEERRAHSLAPFFSRIKSQQLASLKNLIKSCIKVNTINFRNNLVRLFAGEIVFVGLAVSRTMFLSAHQQFWMSPVTAQAPNMIERNYDVTFVTHAAPA